MNALRRAGLEHLRAPLTPKEAQRLLVLVVAERDAGPKEAPTIRPTKTPGITTTVLSNTWESQQPVIIAKRVAGSLTLARGNSQPEALTKELEHLAPDMAVTEGETQCILVSPSTLQTEANVKSVEPDDIFRFLKGDGGMSRFPHVRSATPCRVMLQLIHEFAGNFDPLFEGDTRWISLPYREGHLGYPLLGKPATSRDLPFFTFVESLPSSKAGKGTLLYI